MTDELRAVTTVEGRLIEDGLPARIEIREGRIARIDRDGAVAADRWISPGWMDLQVNGFAGHDPNRADATPDDVIGMVHALRTFGVTAVCPTICTQSRERMLHSIATVAQACRSDPFIASAIPGIHVEGPHISREDGPRGAHPLEHVRPPDLAEYREWQEAADGLIRIVTISAEYESAVDYTRALVADGVVVSVGHTAADPEQIRAVVDAGARWSTHLGNGAHALLPRHPNYIWEQLGEDRLSAGFIFDGHHLPPAVMRTVLRAKGVERSVLVTDAVAIAGMPPGRYTAPVGGDVELLPSGRLVLYGTPYLAGSASTLPECLENAVLEAGASLPDAIRMVTANPSRLIGLASTDGHESVRVGATANLTVFSEREGRIEVDAAIVAGRGASSD